VGGVKNTSQPKAGFPQPGKKTATLSKKTGRRRKIYKKDSGRHGGGGGWGFVTTSKKILVETGGYEWSQTLLAELLMVGRIPPVRKKKTFAARKRFSGSVKRGGKEAKTLKVRKKGKEE